MTTQESSGEKLQPNVLAFLVVLIYGRSITTQAYFLILV